MGCLGVSAFVTQLVLMRELLAVFAGNELTFGVVLGHWMLLTGLGAALGRGARRLRDPIAVLVVAQAAIALLPVVDMLAVRGLRNVIFLRGAAPGFSETVVGSLLLLAPYCLLAGYLLTLACRLLAEHQESGAIGRVYVLDILGDIVGGVLFSFVLVVWFDHFACLYVPAALNLTAALLVAARSGRRLLAAGCLLLGTASAAVAGLDLETRSTQWQHPGQEIVYRGNSPYGRLVVTHLAGQYTFIENGVVLFSTQCAEEIEETVHFAMAQRPKARSVLILGGGITGTAREVLKYGVQRVDYVELDPLVLEVGRRLLPDALADPRIHVIQTDGRLWIKQTQDRYDVLIVDAPEPSTSQLNRLYTREFFAEAARVLAPDGVLSLRLGEYDDWISPEQARLLASVHRTLADVFARVQMLPAGRNVFLASQGELTLRIAERIQAAGVTARWVTPDHLRATLSPDRLADLHRVIDPDAAVNRDFNPILYYYHLRYWMNQFQVRFGLVEAGLLIALGAYVLCIRPVSRVIFAAGLTASALEVVLLLGFQILYGSVYQGLGLIVTCFMLGLGLGAALMNRHLARQTLPVDRACRRRELIALAWALALAAVAVPALLTGLDRLGWAWGSLAGWTLIPGATLGVALLVGAQFPLAGALDFEELSTTASRLYTADYLGAALGALLVSTLLIPLIGVAGVCLLIAGANVLSACVLGRGSGHGR